jgi:hypothetical protein
VVNADFPGFRVGAAEERGHDVACGGGEGFEVEDPPAVFVAAVVAHHGAFDRPFIGHRAPPG